VARNLSKKTRREIKSRKIAAGLITVTSNDYLRSILGLMLWRCWLYSGKMTATEANYRGRQTEESKAVKVSTELINYY